MTRLAIAAALIAAPAFAQDRHEWQSGTAHSWVQIHEPQTAGAVASVTFHDDYLHTAHEEFTLTLDGLTIYARIERMGALPGERLHLTAPEGFYVWPEVLEPGEGERETAHVFPLGLAL